MRAGMVGRRRRPWPGLGRPALRNTLYGLVFAAPWITGLFVFYAYPILASLYYSFTDFSGLQEPVWVGLANYGTLLLQDNEFGVGVYNTIYYALIAVPTGIVVALSLSLMLNMHVGGLAVYRTIYFMPVLVPEVAISIIWLQMFNPQFGLVNAAIEWAASLFGFQIAGPGWLANEFWSKPSLVLLSLWLVGQPVVIYLAGLQDVPQDLVDAAAVDGANAVQRIWHVTIPMLTPVILFNLITSLIAAFQIFTQPYVMTGGTGRPANSLLFYSMLLYQQAFVYFQMGLASAMAWILFAAILTCALCIFYSSARWVYYGSGERR